VRIIHVNKFHFVKGGAERYVFDLSREQTEAGHEVVPFAMSHPANAPTPYARYFPSRIDFDDVEAARTPGTALRIVYSREAERCMERLVDDTQPDVAHLHNIAHQLTPSILRALGRRGVRTVHTLHDYKIACPAYLFMCQGSVCERCRGGRFYQVALRRCHRNSRAAGVVLALEAYVHRVLGSYQHVAAFLCPSRFLRDTMVRHGLPEDKLVHLPYFIPADRYRPAEGAGEDILYAGRLSREKGLSTLLTALRYLPGARLVVVGEGPERASVEAAVREGLPVTLRGHLTGDALHEAVRSARVVVVPSEWYENLPYAVLEAFALGRPVVGARIGGIPELVRDGETGLTFTPGDSEDLARAVRPFLSDPDRAAAMGRAARAFIERAFTPGGHLQRLDAIYEVAA
jgi:glycosyltransferase involved in cell wall biosynthesis